MDQQDLDSDLIKEEFNQHRKQWTDIIVQRTFFYAGLKIKLAEREFQLALSLTTISVAFLAIILPLLLGSGIKISSLAIFGFLIASVSGLIRIFLSIIVDKKAIPKDEKFELDYFKKCQRLAVEIYDDALNRTVNNGKAEEYFNLEKNSRDSVLQREKEKHLLNKILSIIYYSFLLSFIIGFISLFYEIIHYL